MKISLPGILIGLGIWWLVTREPAQASGLDKAVKAAYPAEHMMTLAEYTESYINSSGYTRRVAQGLPVDSPEESYDAYVASWTQNQ